MKRLVVLFLLCFCLVSLVEAGPLIQRMRVRRATLRPAAVQACSPAACAPAACKPAACAPNAVGTVAPIPAVASCPACPQTTVLSSEPPPPPPPVATTDTPQAAANSRDDIADIGEAFARGLGSRLAIGPYRGSTLALRQLRTDLAAARTDAKERYIAAVQAQISVNPQRACTIATFAVIGLEMANAFGANVPQSVIDAAIALRNQVCGTGKK